MAEESAAQRQMSSSAGRIFGSMRFGAEHGVQPMAEQLQGAMAARGVELCIINMMGGGDIDTAVFQTIESCDTFMVFGSARYGEDTGNQACTFYEYKHAFDRKKRIILIRMIPFDQDYEELQGRVIFGANTFALTWLVGSPMPACLVDDIIGAMTAVASSPSPVAPSSPAMAPPSAAWQPSLEEWLGAPMFKSVGAFLQDELGAEEVDDLKELEPEHLEMVKSKLKPLQVPKFLRKYQELIGEESAVSHIPEGVAEKPAAAAQPSDPSLPAPEPSVNRATTPGLTLSDLPDTPLSACRSLWLRRRSGCCSARPARNHLLPLAPTSSAAVFWGWTIRS